MSVDGVPAQWDRSGLPGWSYTSPEMLELEKEHVFRRSWQIVGHVNDIPESGNYMCLDFFGERAVVVRGHDGLVRAFHNVCRHRGSRVVAEAQGQCKAALVCPFHGWAFNLDGTLKAAPRPRHLPTLDPVQHGLKPIEMEIWCGFVFIRFKSGPQPSIAELMEPFMPEISHYRMDKLVPTEGFWTGSTPVNWKAVVDVDNEGYHVPIAHPGLQDLYGDHYMDEAPVNGVTRSHGRFNDGPARLWSVQRYKTHLPEFEHLPPEQRNIWVYYGIFPSTVVYLYPETVGFYQQFPISENQTVLRGAAYMQPDADRRSKLARYLSTRIDRDTTKEDVQLTIWSCEATKSSGYDGIILSDLEYGVRAYHDMLRNLMPVLNEDEAPPPGTLAQMNEQLIGQSPSP